MKNAIMFLLTFLGIVSNIFAYPISPRPLRQLVKESEYIIIGYVIKTYEKKNDKNEWSTKVAKIAVLETLQGKLNRDTIEINFNPNMICPAPDRYFDRTYVISFINQDKKNGRFHTHALNYGAKTLKKEDIGIYKKRIFEIQQIFAIQDKEKQFIETVEWLVKCVEIKITRWEGTSELSPESNFMPYYPPDKTKDYKSVINAEQKERLKKALISSNEMIDFGLVDLVYKDNETIIDEFLFNKFKVLKENDYWVAYEFMNRLKHKNNSIEMAEVLKAYEKLRFEYDKKAELKKTIKKFIDLIKNSLTTDISIISQKNVITAM
jgi:hypothetical protein